jgi:PAS domain S-box-containing protein
MAVSKELERSHFNNINFQVVMLWALALQTVVSGLAIGSISKDYWTNWLSSLMSLLCIVFCLIITQKISNLTNQADDRLEIETKLRESEERWHLALRGSNDGIWDFNLITNEKFLSKRLLEINGYEFSEVATFEQWSQLIHPADRNAVIEAFQKHINRETPQYVIEYRLLTKSGDYKWLLDRGQAIWDDNGKALRVAGSTTDISDRKHAEEALQVSEARMQSFLDNAPTPIAIKDLEGTYLSVNREFEYLVRVPNSEILGKKDLDMFPPEIVKQIRERELQAIFEEIAVSFEESVPLPDGLHTFIMTKFPLLDERDRPYLVAGIYLDISDRKRAELELSYNYDLREEIYNGSADAIFLVDPLSLLTFDCNRRAVDLFEAESKKELIGIAGHTLQKNLFTEAEFISIENEIHEFGFWSKEVEYVTKKGKYFWGNLAVKRIIVADKEIDLVRVTDISDRKRAEAAIKESDARFQKITSISPEAIYILIRDRNGITFFERCLQA